MFYRIGLIFLLVFVAVSGTDEQCLSASSRIFAVWSSPTNNKQTTLLYSWKENGHWRSPKELAVHQGLHVTPVIAVDKKNIIWIIWVEQTDQENILRYAQIDTGHVKTGRVSNLVNEHSYAPAIVIDSHDVPLIAWSAVTDKFADIYSSRWNGSGWNLPLMVNKKNNTPDITPILGLGEKKLPWVSWFGITEAHRYVQFVAKWKNGIWNVDKNTLPSINIKNFIKKRMRIEVQLPEQAGKRLMGAVFVDSGKEIQSISERFIAFQPPRGQR